MNLKILFLAYFLAACSTMKVDFWNEYKIDIQQGNVLSQDAVSQLRRGLSRAQVQQLLGTPALQDIFHQNRWVYPYQYIEGQTGKTQSVVLSVFFDENGLLSHVSGDVQGAEEMPEMESKVRLVELSALSQEQAQTPLAPRKPPSFWERMKNFAGF